VGVGFRECEASEHHLVSSKGSCLFLSSPILKGRLEAYLLEVACQMPESMLHLWSL
jgi:hypothetical protein